MTRGVSLAMHAGFKDPLCKHPHLFPSTSLIKTGLQNFVPAKQMGLDKPKPGELAPVGSAVIGAPRDVSYVDFNNRTRHARIFIIRVNNASESLLIGQELEKPGSNAVPFSIHSDSLANGYHHVIYDPKDLTTPKKGYYITLKNN
jgi:hypothetical protein